MKLKEICGNSNLVLSAWGYRGRHRHLPIMLKYAPQHLVYGDECPIKLVYFKPSFDSRFIELSFDEVKCLRYWDALHDTIIFVYNYIYDKFTYFTISFFNSNIHRARRERGKYLINNLSFNWLEKTTIIKTLEANNETR